MEASGARGERGVQPRGPGHVSSNAEDLREWPLLSPGPGAAERRRLLGEGPSAFLSGHHRLLKVERCPPVPLKSPGSKEPFKS